jgi:hypothetical protein
MTETIRPLVEYVLANYQAAKSDPSALKDRSHPMKQALEQLEAQLELTPSVTHRKLSVRRHVGTQRWRDVPLLDIGGSAEQHPKDDSLLVRLLFSADMSRLYLTIGAQAERPSKYRDYLAGVDGEWRNAGFSLAPRIVLHAKSPRDRERESDNVVVKAYERGAIPSDQVLASDIETILHLRDQLLTL